MGSARFRKHYRRIRSQFRRHRHALQVVGVLSLVCIAAYAGYMNDQRTHVNPSTYKPLLHLIGSAESNNNYNAHFGNAANTAISFTEMPIRDVLAWQENFVQQGNPSSAVGRYQIINTTLEGLVSELKINTDQKFSEATQDAMAIALLERRGSQQYVNGKLSAKEFAANLSKEWAALPKTVGSNPDASYYAGDGINASRVTVSEVLTAIAPISSE